MWDCVLAMTLALTQPTTSSHVKAAYLHFVYAVKTYIYLHGVNPLNLIYIVKRQVTKSSPV